MRPLIKFTFAFIIICISATCTSTSDDASVADASRDSSALAEDIQTDETSGSESDKKSTPKNCRQFKTSENCRNAGCYFEDAAKFGVLRDEGCKVTEPKPTSICLRRKNPEGDTSPAETTYVRKESDENRRKVMHLSKLIYDLTGPWELCDDAFPLREDCGCDF